MTGRTSAILTMSRKAAFGLIAVATLALAACGGSGGGGTSSTPNASLTSCSISSADLKPTVTSTGTATAVSGLTGQKISGDGSSALQPLIAQAAAEFDKANGTQSTIAAGGSGQGLKDVEAGAVQIGDSDVYAASKA